MKRKSFAKASVVCGLALAAVIAGPALSADKIPDIKGKWVGKTHSIIAGMAPHWPSNMGTFQKPGLFEKDLEIDITGQDGNRFWGNQIFTSSPARTIAPSSSSTPTATSTASSSATTRSRSATPRRAARRNRAW
jgi:hypothetical protein